MSRDFDGVDDDINIGSGPALDALDSGPLTITAWIKPDGAGEGSGTSFGRIAQKPNAGFIVFIFGGTTRPLRFVKDFTGTDLNVITTDVIPTTAWTHVAVTWDGSATATNVHIYINGAEASYGTQTNGTVAQATDANQSWLIGSAGGGANSFDGKIAYTSFHSAVLSLGEIKQLMMYPGSVTRALASFNPLWGGSPEPDYSGNGNHGTVTGALVSADNPPINGIFTIPKPELIHTF